MDDKKQDETTPVSTDTASNDTQTVVNSAETVVSSVVDSVSEVATPVIDSVTEAASNAADTVANAVEEVTNKSFNIRAYVGAVVVILVICAGLMFVLEKEGRISTGLFSGIISKMEAKSPAAIVNDVEISKSEFNSSVQQLTEMAAAQGAAVADSAATAQFEKQAIETLVNAELLRQAAVSEGMTTTPEQIEARFNEIRDGIGGAEKLTARMNEFGVTEASLRRDIENEFLIQGLFDSKIDSDAIAISETEVATFYEKAGGTGAGLPPFAEVRDQVEAQVRFEKEQVLIGEYLEVLKKDAEIKILI